MFHSLSDVQGEGQHALKNVNADVFDTCQPVLQSHVTQLHYHQRSCTQSNILNYKYSCLYTCEHYVLLARSSTINHASEIVCSCNYSIRLTFLYNFLAMLQKRAIKIVCPYIRSYSTLIIVLHIDV